MRVLQLLALGLLKNNFSFFPTIIDALAERDALAVVANELECGVLGFEIIEWGGEGVVTDIVLWNGLFPVAVGG